MRILLTISYDGTNFNGYQVQVDKRTVESELNLAIKKITGEDVKTIASGRTDSGVHAVSQKVHFDTNSTIPPNKFYCALNTVLPCDIRVTSSKKVSDTFNARYSAKKKTYKYSCYISEVENPLYSRYKALLKYSLDLEKIKKACKIIEGEHDFKCFLASGSSVKDTVRTIYSIKVVKKGELIDFYVTGNGFLYNMVRIVVGTLVKVGENRLELSTLKKAIETGDRNLVGKTMPSNGLCLYNVVYRSSLKNVK